MSKSCIIMDKENIRFDNAVFNEFLSLGIENNQHNESNNEFNGEQNIHINSQPNVSIVVNGSTLHFAPHINFVPPTENSDWEDAKRELLQTYLLSQFQQQQTPILKKNNQPFTLDESIPSLKEFDELILSKLKNNITKENLWEYLHSCFIDKLSMDLNLAQSFMDQIIESFNVSIPSDKELCSIFYNKLYFNNSNYNDFLTKPLGNDSKRELTQFYFLICCMKEFNSCDFLINSSDNAVINIDPSNLSIDDNIFQHIQYKLSQEINHQDFFNYLRTVLVGFKFDDEKSNIVASKILPSIFNSLEINPTNELSINTQKNLYFNFSMIDSFLNSQLSDDVKRELVQVYFLFHYNEKYSVDYFTNLSEVKPYLLKIETALKRKISKEDYLRYISFLEDMHPEFEQQSSSLYSVISSGLKILDFEHNHLISYYPELDYNPLELQKMLSEPLNNESFDEFAQAYFLIQCLKKFNLNMTNEKNKIIIVSEDFKEILEYEDEIEEKIKNCTSKAFMSSIHYMKKNIFFSKEDDCTIIDSILPQAIQSLCIEDHRYYKDIIYIFDKTFRFQKKLCHEYLHSDPNNEIKKELAQAYFLAKYIEFFPQSVIHNNITLHSSMNDLNTYLPNIRNYLKENITESELDEYIDILYGYLDILAKEKEILFDQLSIDLEAIEDPDFLLNDIIKVVSSLYTTSDSDSNVHEDRTLSSLSFNERICKKLLSKNLCKNSIRDLCQAYFCYQYFDKLGTMVGKNHNLVEFTNIDNIAPYINSIVDKLNGFVKDKEFDEAISIITDRLNITEDQHIDMTKYVFYPIKKSLGLTKPSLLKHLL